MNETGLSVMSMVVLLVLLLIVAMWVILNLMSGMLMLSKRVKKLEQRMTAQEERDSLK